MDNVFDEVCTNCGLTFGSHRGDSICHNQCPKHQGYMDWPTMEEGGITTFVGSGIYREVLNGTKSLKFGGTKIEEKKNDSTSSDKVVEKEV